jgi:hypothetical protein
MPESSDKSNKNKYIRLNDFDSDDEINNESLNSQSGLLKQEVGSLVLFSSI